MQPLLTPTGRVLLHTNSSKHSTARGVNVRRKLCGPSRVSKRTKRPLLGLSQKVNRLDHVQATFTDLHDSIEIETTGQFPTPFNWLDQWYPVAFESCIDKASPYRFILLKIPLVVWWDKNGERWRAFKDVCPHRLVPLSEGRVNQKGELECGYHGWTFNGQGSCTSIPQGAKLGSKRSCATVYECVQRQGLVFVKPIPVESDEEGTAVDESRLPLIEELDDPTWVSLDYWRDLPMDWATLMTNVIDSSHVPFTHHSTISNRNQIGAYDMKLDSKVSLQGYNGTWKTGPKAGKYGPQTTLVRFPSLLKHKLESRKGDFDALTISYAVPTAPGRCRMINRNGFKFNSPLPRLVFRLLPQFLAHLRAHIPLEDDQIFLHEGEATLNKALSQGDTVSRACYMPSQADTLVVAFYTWLSNFGGGGPFGPITTLNYQQQVQPRQSREQLLDRYSQHTENCAVCQATLAKVQVIRKLLKISFVVFASFAVLAASVAIAACSLPSSTAVVASASTQLPSSWFAGTQSTALHWLLTAARWVAGATSPMEGMWRALGWGAAAVAAALAAARMSVLKRAFFKGVYPPPRNTATD